MTRWVAVLDRQDRLRGVRQVVDDAAVPPDAVSFPHPIDLPTDRTQRWNRETRAFEPVERVAVERPSRPPVAPTYVLYLAMKALIARDPDGFPAEVAQFVAWYEEEEASRQEERVVQARRRRL